MRSMLVCAVLVAMVFSVSVVPAELVSKSYQFKSDVTLEIGHTMSGGLRVDSVRFELPTAPGGRVVRTGGLARARVAISNTGDSSHRVGIAIALFDSEGRLVAVASGGTQVMPIRGGRQKTFALVFDDVNALSGNATSFQISVETKP